MNAAQQSFPYLATLAQQVAAGGGTAPLSAAAGAASDAIRFVDQQVAAIGYATIQGGFPGAAEMAQALALMRATADQWPATRSQVMDAAQRIVEAGPAAATLGAGAAPSGLQAFATQVMPQLEAAFTAAVNVFNGFTQAMEKTYASSANANQAAANALTTERLQIQNQIDNLHAREQSLSSAGSIITGIFTLGISYAVQIRQLEEEQANLQNAMAQQQHEQACYQMSLGTFMNALDATKLASYALDTLQTSLQQTGNSLSDIQARSSSNPAVMAALLQQFASQFAQAVQHAQQLLA